MIFIKLFLKIFFNKFITNLSKLVQKSNIYNLFLIIFNKIIKIVFYLLIKLIFIV